MTKSPILTVLLSVVLFSGLVGYNQASAGGPPPVEAPNCIEDLEIFSNSPTSASSGTPTSAPHCEEWIPGDSWFFGEESDRIPIGHQPGAGPWVKILPLPVQEIQTGQIIPLPPGYVDDLHEFIVIGGNTEWSDWHEEIQTPGWEFISFGIDINGQPVDFPNAISPDGQSIWIDFVPPLPPGTELDIWKDVECVAPNGCGTLFLEVWEYPTVPEKDPVIAGELLPIDSTALVISGISSEYSALSISALLGAVSAGTLYFVTRRTF